MMSTVCLRPHCVGRGGGGDDGQGQLAGGVDWLGLGAGA